ncbi:MULTIPOLAR SPINDLE 1-like protein [Drosera capensis]
MQADGMAISLRPGGSLGGARVLAFLDSILLLRLLLLLRMSSCFVPMAEREDSLLFSLTRFLYNLQMKDLDAAKKILGMKISRDRATKNDAKPVSTPLDAQFKLSAQMCPGSEEEVERMSLVSYGMSAKSDLVGMVDVDYADDLDSRRSASGYDVIALSTTEAKYITFIEDENETLWLRNLGSRREKIREWLTSEVVDLQKVHTKKNTTDMLTKIVPKIKIQLIEFLEADHVLTWSKDEAFDSRLFEKWMKSVAHARKALALLESRGSLYSLYMDRVISELARQLGQIPTLQKKHPHILDCLLC